MGPVQAGQGESGLFGQQGGTVGVDPRPGEPLADRVGRFQPDPAGHHAGERRVDLDEAASTSAQQLCRDAQEALRVTAQPHRPVGQQHGRPLSHPWQRSEDVAVQNRGAAPTRQSYRRGRLVHPQRGNTATDQAGHQTGGPASQLDRRPVTHGDHRGVERLVGAVAAQPLGDRQVRHSTARIADPASFAAQRPLVELSQHRHPALGSAARGRALGGSPPTGRPPQ